MKNGKGGSMVKGFDIKMLRSNDIKIVFKPWGPIRIYQLISTANSAQFHSKRTGLVVLIIAGRF